MALVVVVWRRRRTRRREGRSLLRHELLELIPKAQ